MALLWLLSLRIKEGRKSSQITIMKQVARQSKSNLESRFEAKIIPVLQVLDCPYAIDNRCIYSIPCFCPKSKGLTFKLRSACYSSLLGAPGVFPEAHGRLVSWTTKKQVHRFMSNVFAWFSHFCPSWWNLVLAVRYMIYHMVYTNRLSSDIPPKKLNSKNVQVPLHMLHLFIWSRLLQDSDPQSIPFITSWRSCAFTWRNQVQLNFSSQAVWLNKRHTPQKTLTSKIASR